MAEGARAIGVTEATYYRWRAEYGGLRLDQVRRLGLGDNWMYALPGFVVYTE